MKIPLPAFIDIDETSVHFEMDSYGHPTTKYPRDRSTYERVAMVDVFVKVKAAADDGASSFEELAEATGLAGAAAKIYIAELIMHGWIVLCEPRFEWGKGTMVPLPAADSGLPDTPTQ